MGFCLFNNVAIAAESAIADRGLERVFVLDWDVHHESADFAQMGCHVRDLAASLGAPVGAVLEGGYDLGALADGVIAMLTALSGIGDAESIAPDPILTSRAAAQFGRYWSL